MPIEIKIALLWVVQNRVNHPSLENRYRQKMQYFYIWKDSFGKLFSVLLKAFFEMDNVFTTESLYVNFLWSIKSFRLRV